MPTRESPDTVDGVMIPTETGCLMNNYAQDVVDVLEQLDHEYMPVVDSFACCQPLGVVTRTDLRRLLGERHNVFVADALMAAAPVVPAGRRLDRLSQRVAEVSVVLVVNQSGALMGYLEIAAVLPYPLRVDGPGPTGRDT